jgi:hypothetical protein
MWNPRLRPDPGSIADLKVIQNSGLTRKNHLLANLSAPCDPRLRDDDGILSHDHVVRNLHQVINFYASSDNGSS